MRTALLSDIHGDLESLRRVLDDARAQHCNRILCLGDLIDGGPHSIEVARLVRDHAIPCTRGNHDEASAATLPADVRGFLLALPESIVEGDVLYTHISPHPRPRKIEAAFDAWNAFDDSTQRLAFIGHTHIAAIWGRLCAEPISATAHPIRLGEPFLLQPHDRYIICVGAVGRTRDWCPRRCYVIYDSRAQSVTFRAAE